MNLDPFVYSFTLKASYLLIIVPTIIVITTAVMSSKEIGGTLGKGLKKTAVGSIIHTILFMTYLLIERGNKGILDENIIKIFFFAGSIFGSILLIAGYAQIYKIARNLKLFTV